MNQELIERAMLAVDAERKKISLEFAKHAALNEANKKSGKPYVSCWPLGLEYSKRCAIAALSVLENK